MASFKHGKVKWITDYHQNPKRAGSIIGDLYFPLPFCNESTVIIPFSNIEDDFLFVPSLISLGSPGTLPIIEDSP